jgi:hypothetical protein
MGYIRLHHKNTMLVIDGESLSVDELTELNLIVNLLGGMSHKDIMASACGLMAEAQWE